MPVFTVEVEKAVPLHPQVKRKWEKCGQMSPRSATLENLEVKLQAAEQRREIFLQARRARTARYRSHTPRFPRENDDDRESKAQAALDRLHHRLAAAEAKRAALLERVKARAGADVAATVARTARAALAEANRRTQLEIRLEESLKAAEAARAAHLADTAAKAAKVFARARSRARSVKRHAEIEAAERRKSLLRRLEKASARRLHRTVSEPNARCALAEMVATKPLKSILNDVAAKAAAENIQKRWRAVVAGPGTTAMLAENFIASGLPFSVGLGLSLNGNRDAANRTEQRRTVSASQSEVKLPRPRRQPIARSASSVAETAAFAAAADTRTVPGLEVVHTSRSFEDFAAIMSSQATLRAASAYLRRLERLFRVFSRTEKSISRGCGCEALVKRLFPKAGKAPDRYPVRVFLSAYMIVAHPQVVMSQQGPREAALSSAAGNVLTAFEALLKLVASMPPTLLEEGDTDMRHADSDVSGEESIHLTRKKQLVKRFDEAWISYLEQFVAWKSHDAAGLEADLIRAAVDLESSRAAKLAARRDGTDDEPGTPKKAMHLRGIADLQALVEAVDHDLKLIAERVERLTGSQGVARLEAALAAVRAMSPIGSGLSSSASPAKKVPRRSGRYSGEGIVASGNGGENGGNNADADMDLAREDVDGNDVGECPRAVQAGPSLLASKFSTPGTEDPQQPDDGTSMKLALVWQLLYDPAWRLSGSELEREWTDATGKTNPRAEPALTVDDVRQGGDGATEELQARLRRIAEQARWDAVVQYLGPSGPSSADGGGAAMAAAALVDAGLGLVSVLSTVGSTSAASRQRIEDIRQEFGDVERLTARLSPPSTQTAASPPLPGIDCNELFALLQRAASLFRELGAPARDGLALEAHAVIVQDMAGATTTEAAAKVVARALRLLNIQMRMLRLDVANASLEALSGQVGGSVERLRLYAASKLESPSALGPIPTFPSTMSNPNNDLGGTAELYQRLPHARAWLALASGRLPQIETALPGHYDPGRSASSSLYQSTVPQTLKTGLQRGKSKVPVPQRGGAPHLVAAVPIRSWRGLVRCGLVHLVEGEGALTRLALPETLRFDVGRLMAAQAEFQRVVVLTVCLRVIVQGATRSQGSGEAHTHCEEQQQDAVRRLGAVLAAPDVCLADVSFEVAALKRRLNKNGKEENAMDEGETRDTSTEGEVHAAIRAGLSKSGPVLRAVRAGLGEALTIHLLRGVSGRSSSEPQKMNLWDRAAVSSLIRCGAGALSDQIEALGTALGQVAAVTEAVCGPWYEALASDLLLNSST